MLVLKMYHTDFLFYGEWYIMNFFFIKNMKNKKEFYLSDFFCIYVCSFHKYAQLFWILSYFL